MAENRLTSMSMEFAVAILRFTGSINGHPFLVDQLERSATSVGANIREAYYAYSKQDFIFKLTISLKECYETEYWLELIELTELSESDQLRKLIHDCGSIRRILIKSINTAKINKAREIVDKRHLK